MQLKMVHQKAAGDIRGFTLVEILVVVAIIGLLATIAIPQFISYRARGFDTQMKGDLKNAALAMESYFAEKQSYPTSLAALVNVGFTQTNGVALTIDVTSPASFTITAAKPSGTQPSFTYDSSTGTID